MMPGPVLAKEAIDGAGPVLHSRDSRRACPGLTCRASDHVARGPASPRRDGADPPDRPAGFRAGPGALGLAFRRGRLRSQRQQTLRAGR